jgi:hypothetical protein
MSDTSKPLFNRNLLKVRVDSFVTEITEEQSRVATDWARAVADPSFKRENEKPQQGAFLNEVFGLLLGYEHFAGNPDDYSLKA